MAEIRNIFASNLKEKRKKCGLTQAGLAEKLSVSTHHIAMMEIARNYPTLDLVERIAEVLNIQIYELFIEPLSPKKELDRLYDRIAENIEELVCKTI